MEDLFANVATANDEEEFGSFSAAANPTPSTGLASQNANGITSRADTISDLFAPGNLANTTAGMKVEDEEDDDDDDDEEEEGSGTGFFAEQMKQRRKQVLQSGGFSKQLQKHRDVLKNNWEAPEEEGTGGSDLGSSSTFGAGVNGHVNGMANGYGMGNSTNANMNANIIANGSSSSFATPQSKSNNAPALTPMSNFASQIAMAATPLRDNKTSSIGMGATSNMNSNMGMDMNGMIASNSMNGMVNNAADPNQFDPNMMIMMMNAMQQVQQQQRQQQQQTTSTPFSPDANMAMNMTMAMQQMASPMMNNAPALSTLTAANVSSNQDDGFGSFDSAPQTQAQTPSIPIASQLPAAVENDFGDFDSAHTQEATPAAATGTPAVVEDDDFGSFDSAPQTTSAAEIGPTMVELPIDAASALPMPTSLNTMSVSDAFASLEPAMPETTTQAVDTPSEDEPANSNANEVAESAAEVPMDAAVGTNMNMGGDATMMQQPMDTENMSEETRNMMMAAVQMAMQMSNNPSIGSMDIATSGAQMPFSPQPTPFADSTKKSTSSNDEDDEDFGTFEDAVQSTHTSTPSEAISSMFAPEPTDAMDADDTDEFGDFEDATQTLNGPSAESQPTGDTDEDAFGAFDDLQPPSALSTLTGPTIVAIPSLDATAQGADDDAFGAFEDAPGTASRSEAASKDEEGDSDGFGAFEDAANDGESTDDFGAFEDANATTPDATNALSRSTSGSAEFDDPFAGLPVPNNDVSALAEPALSGAAEPAAMTTANINSSTMQPMKVDNTQPQGTGNDDDDDDDFGDFDEAMPSGDLTQQPGPTTMVANIPQATNENGGGEEAEEEEEDDPFAGIGPDSSATPLPATMGLSSAMQVPAPPAIDMATIMEPSSLMMTTADELLASGNPIADHTANGMNANDEDGDFGDFDSAPPSMEMNSGQETAQEAAPDDDAFGDFEDVTPANATDTFGSNDQAAVPAAQSSTFELPSPTAFKPASVGPALSNAVANPADAISSMMFGSAADQPMAPVDAQLNGGSILSMTNAQTTSMEIAPTNRNGSDANNNGQEDDDDFGDFEAATADAKASGDVPIDQKPQTFGVAAVADGTMPTSDAATDAFSAFDAIAPPVKTVMSVGANIDQSPPIDDDDGFGDFEDAMQDTTPTPEQETAQSSIIRNGGASDDDDEEFGDFEDTQQQQQQEPPSAMEMTTNMNAGADADEDADAFGAFDDGAAPEMQSGPSTAAATQPSESQDFDDPFSGLPQAPAPTLMPDAPTETTSNDLFADSSSPDEANAEGDGIAAGTSAPPNPRSEVSANVSQAPENETTAEQDASDPFSHFDSLAPPAPVLGETLESMMNGAEDLATPVAAATLPVGGDVDGGEDEEFGDFSDPAGVVAPTETPISTISDTTVIQPVGHNNEGENDDDEDFGDFSGVAPTTDTTTAAGATANADTNTNMSGGEMDLTPTALNGLVGDAAVTADVNPNVPTTDDVDLFNAASLSRSDPAQGMTPPQQPSTDLFGFSDTPVVTSTSDAAGGALGVAHTQVILPEPVATTAAADEDDPFGAFDAISQDPAGLAQPSQEPTLTMKSTETEATDDFGDFGAAPSAESNINSTALASGDIAQAKAVPESAADNGNDMRFGDFGSAEAEERTTQPPGADTTGNDVFDAFAGAVAVQAHDADAALASKDNADDDDFGNFDGPTTTESQPAEDSGADFGDFGGASQAENAKGEEMEATPDAFGAFDVIAPAPPSVETQPVAAGSSEDFDAFGAFDSVAPVPSSEGPAITIDVLEPASDNDAFGAFDSIPSSDVPQPNESEAVPKADGDNNNDGAPNTAAPPTEDIDDSFGDFGTTAVPADAPDSKVGEAAVSTSPDAEQQQSPEQQDLFGAFESNNTATPSPSSADGNTATLIPNDDFGDFEDAEKNNNGSTAAGQDDANPSMATDDDTFGDFTANNSAIATTGESKEVAAMDTPKPNEDGDKEADFGDFGGFEAANAGADTPETFHQETVEEAAPKKDTANDHDVGDDFGNFDTPEMNGHAAPKDTDQANVSADCDDFGDFGGFESAQDDQSGSAAAQAADSVNEPKEEDDGADFGDFGTAAASAEVADEPKTEALAMDATNAENDDDDDFGDFGDFDSAPASQAAENTQASAAAAATSDGTAPIPSAPADLSDDFGAFDDDFGDFDSADPDAGAAAHTNTQGDDAGAAPTSGQASADVEDGDDHDFGDFGDFDAAPTAAEAQPPAEQQKIVSASPADDGDDDGFGDFDSAANATKPPAAAEATPQQASATSVAAAVTSSDGNDDDDDGFGDFSSNDANAFETEIQQPQATQYFLKDDAHYGRAAAFLSRLAELPPTKISSSADADADVTVNAKPLSSFVAPPDAGANTNTNSTTKSNQGESSILDIISSLHKSKQKKTSKSFYNKASGGYSHFSSPLPAQAEGAPLPNKKLSRRRSSAQMRMPNVPDVLPIELPASTAR